MNTAAGHHQPNPFQGRTYTLPDVYRLTTDKVNGKREISGLREQTQQPLLVRQRPAINISKVVGLLDLQGVAKKDTQSKHPVGLGARENSEKEYEGGGGKDVYDREQRDGAIGRERVHHREVIEMEIRRIRIKRMELDG